MRTVLRAIGGGAALGTAFFLAPGLGRVLGALALTGAALRLLGGRGRAARRARWRQIMQGAGGPVPIDNHWPAPRPAATGPARYVAVS